MLNWNRCLYHGLTGLQSPPSGKFTVEIITRSKADKDAANFEKLVADLSKAGKKVKTYAVVVLS